MIAKIKRLTRPPALDTNWNAQPWRQPPSQRLRNYMGEKPDHFPNTEVKIAYDAESIFVIFRVEDNYVRAVAENDQDSVCRDSCVEFFFTPGPDVSNRYFNLEMNCGGTMLFHFNSGPRTGTIELTRGDCDRITRAHSLPHIVAPEIQEPVTWTVAYAVPIDLLAQYAKVTLPAPQAKWRANFYKCADETSHPHWLTWAPVNHPKPNFHLPHAFGVLEFE